MTTKLDQLGVLFNDNTLQKTTTPKVGRNRFINGAMEVDQRLNGVASAVNAASTEYLSVDRYQSYGSVAGKFTVQQNMSSVVPPSGFAKYLGFKSATAYTTLLAADYFSIGQRIEGNLIADLLWGTANAKTITISFWARSSLTGTFSAVIRNITTTHCYNFTYSLPTANTWTKIEVTVPGCTIGTWATDSSGGLFLMFNMGTGTTNSTSNVNVWEAGFKTGVTGAVKVVSTLNATFYITGLQLEEGSVATEFEKLPYHEEFTRCQRYYQIVYANTRAHAGAGVVLTLPVHYYTNMRTSPTVTLVAGSRSSNLAAVSVVAGANWAAHRVQTNATGGDTYALNEKVILLAEL